MLRISRLTDYATTIVLHLQNCEGLQSSDSIASAVSVEIPTASKILKLLTKAQLLTSVRGANGGYSIADNNHEITLYDVILAIEGNTAITECSKKNSVCAQQQACETRTGWQKVNDDIKEVLLKMTIKRMAELNNQPQSDVPVRIKDYV